MTWVTNSNAALLTDLYELTMAASYLKHGFTGPATFDLFVRHLPPERKFLVACGLEQALDYLENLHFDDEAIAYLRSLDLFDEDFLSHLSGLRFTGDVSAIPEGEVVFEREPLIRLTAPMIEAQIVETFLLNCITYQTMVASKSARVSLACADRTFIDFSPRRDHGADAALKAARAAFVGGAVGTSNVLAGKSYGIPVSGTMAHSYIMAFEDEITAFRAFARDFPNKAVLLIDTFDTEEGARRAAQVIKELEPEGVHVAGVRIDSGELGPLTRAVRKILDEAGLTDTRIILSGDLDEYRIKELLDEDTPADAFGVGTKLGTSADAPSLGSVYKLVADKNGFKIKLSTGKATLPGCKQVFRFEEDGVFQHDLIALESESHSGTPLLRKVMSKGQRSEAPEPLSILQARCTDALARLPHDLRSLEKGPAAYTVSNSEQLEKLLDRMRAQQR
jgi:nicotinate phosphoribosyltransferase